MAIYFEKFSNEEMDIILRDLSACEKLDVTNLFEKYNLEEKNKNKKKSDGDEKIRKEKR